jgi:hypothetical protein
MALECSPVECTAGNAAGDSAAGRGQSEGIGSTVAAETLRAARKATR